MQLRFVAVGCMLATAFACSKEQSGGEGGAGGDGVPPTGECDRAQDCEQGEDCVEVTPGGWRICVAPVEEATSCTDPANEPCCSTADCQEGVCVDGPVTLDCGGIYVPGFNACATDLCQSDSDCTSGDGPGVCLPQAMLGYKVRGCLPAACRVNADCTAEAGGYCALVRDECCYKTGLYCVYPSNGCLGVIKEECGSGYCMPSAGPEGAHCQPSMPPC
jgi:hypothetical protein